MSKVYAIVGQSGMTVVADTVKYTPSTGEILMQGERPEGDYVASEDGTWVAPAPSVEERLAALDKQYLIDKENLRNAYQDAQMYGNSKRAEEIKADLVALDEQYDADYEAIESEGVEDE